MTEILQPTEKNIERAARVLRAGHLVAMPTETVYGLAADAMNEAAAARIFEAKGRPSDNPLIVHLNDHRDWTKVASSLPPHAKSLLDAFSPGPITVVLPIFFA